MIPSRTRRSPSRRPVLDRLRKPRRRGRADPVAVVEDFRKRFPDIPVPDPGPEPQPGEGKLEPHAIEQAGVVWAIRTAEGIADKFAAGDERSKEVILNNVVPALLDSREAWERKTAEGIKRFVSEMMEEEL